MGESIPEAKVNIADYTIEARLVGCFFKSPELFAEYDDLIDAEIDFTNSILRFLYNLVREIWYAGFTKIDETTINIELNKDPVKKERFEKQCKGYNTVIGLMQSCNVADTATYYKQLKKYSVCRELEGQGFPISSKWDKIKNLDLEAIYGYYDHLLSKTFSKNDRVFDSVILGKDMKKVYESYKTEPDIGIEIPYFITNRLIRGWRLRKLNSTGLHSGGGKSRWASLIAFYIGVVLQIPILLIINEQDLAEWESLILTCCVNNLIGKKYGVEIDEEKIITGQCNELEDKVCKEASEYIEKHSKIYFQEAEVYDYQTLKRILKVHKRKGVNYFILDTFKPFRGDSSSGRDSWENFVKASEELKNVCKNEKKGGLNLAGWFTFQLTDDSLFDSFLSSNSVAGGKQIKHNLDFMMMMRPLTYTEKQKIKVRIVSNNAFNGELMPLDVNQDYYMAFVDKNRGGKDKHKIIYRVSKGKVIFEELGFAVFENPDDEQMLQNRKFKKK